MYGAHDVLLCIEQGAHIEDPNRRRLTPEHYFKSAAEMRELFADLPEACDNTLVIAQRCAYMPDAAQADPAALHQARRPRREATRCSEMAEAGLAALQDGGRLSRRHRLRKLPGAARLRARHDRADGLLRLLPDRRRLHPVGQGQRHPGRARAAARAPARWSPGRSRSPTSIRCAGACCSSASSIPSACRCRTSISTSARTSATG